MTMLNKRRLLFISLLLALGLGLLRIPILHSATGVANQTVQIVDHLGNVLGGTASAVTAVANSTVQVVNSSGLVLDALGASTTIYPNTVPSAGQVPVGNAGGTAYAPQSVSADGTLASTGALNVVATHLASALPVNQGGSGTTTPALIAGTNITITGSWPNQTINAAAAAGVVTVKKQTFLVTGTYTPSTGMLFAMIECVGNGGGGGGTVGSATGTSGAGGGGAGSYSRVLVTAAQVGASQAVTVGATGTGAVAGNNPGTAGGDVSVGALCVGKGGAGGAGAAAASAGAGGAGGIAGTGNITAVGNSGNGGFGAGNGSQGLAAGGGGAGPFGGSAGGTFNTTGGTCVAGSAGGNYGAGGGGALCITLASNTAGGTGSTGVVYITEYNSQ